MAKVPAGTLPAFRSKCPVASALDLVGDRWTMLIIRDLFLGASRYSDFRESPEKIPTNILASRLKTMEALGIVTKEAYQTKPPRFAYRLTPMGHSLSSVMRALADWGMAWLPGRDRKPPKLGFKKRETA